MPNFDFECEACGKVEERSVPVDQCQMLQTCSCGRPMRKLFSFRVMPSRFPYVHDNLDSVPVLIKDRKQEKGEFAKRGLIDAR